MQNDQQPTSKKKPILIGLAVMVAVIVLSVGTAFLLRTVNKSESPSSQSATTSPATPNQVIEAYKKPGAVAALSEVLYQQLNEASDAYVSYTLSGHNYSVSTLTKERALFSAKGTLKEDDTKKVQDQTAEFMRTKEYNKAETPDQAAKNVPTVTYASETAVCQLTSSEMPVPENMRAYHQLACIEQSEIEKEYAFIEKMLVLYKTSHPIMPFKGISRLTRTEDNKSYTLLRVTGAETSPILLFAAIGDSWAFIGDLGGSNGAQQTNAKYTITPEIKAAISDPKYGGFLLKYFGRNL